MSESPAPFRFFGGRTRSVLDCDELVDDRPSFKPRDGPPTGGAAGKERRRESYPDTNGRAGRADGCRTLSEGCSLKP
jgi:hypothetical protein